MNNVTRRGFIGRAGIGATALGVVAAGGAFADEAATEEKPAGSWRTAEPQIDDSEIAQVEECDVLVIGLGHAGCCAMRAAAEAGAKVYAIQETAEDAHYFMGGETGHINSQFLKNRGVPEVDPVEFLNDWQVRTNNRSNPALVNRYIQNCGACFDWLYDGLTPEELEQYFHVKRLEPEGPFVRNLSGVKSWVGTARPLTGDRNCLEEALKRCVQIGIDAGGKVLWETKAVKLVRDAEGTVMGAIGEGPDGYVQVNASKGVILATGGFGSNPEMREDLLWEIKNSFGPNDEFACNLDRDGSGIQMGYWAGGKLDPHPGTMDGISWYPTDSPKDPIGGTLALWINAEGDRYCNEGFGTADLSGLVGSRQPDGIISTVFDSNVEELIRVQPYGHMTYDYTLVGFDGLHEVMDKAYAGGPLGSSDGEEAELVAGADKNKQGSATVFAADDYETLGTYLGYEGDALEHFVASIERYNELCEKGVDEDFGKDPSLMIPVNKPPYYGYRGTKALGVLMVTLGGLLVDANGEVLGDDYRPIKGLFAAGNASGGRFGGQYSPAQAGQSVSMAQTLGMTTGAYVASL